MSETTDANGDPIQDGKQYRLDFATGEMVPVEPDDEDDVAA